jgi:peptidoglycan/LPS O-acetylase OafA/YrhL
MPCRADALLLGVLGAVVMREPRYRSWLQDRRRFVWSLFVVLASGLFILTKFSFDIRGVGMAMGGYTWLAGFYLCGLICALLNPTSLLSRCLRWSWLGFLGQIAYGTYLFHFVVLYVLFALLRSHPPRIESIGDLAVTLSSVATTLIFCRASWVYLESPLIRMGHQQAYNFSCPSQR